MKASTTWVFLGIKAKGLAARARQSVGPDP